MSKITFIVWKDEFSVGSQTLDAQHTLILNMINKLYNEMQLNSHPKHLNKKIRELYLYVATHFSMEERIMQEYGFPGLQSHIEEHRTYAQKTDDFMRQIQSTYGDISFDFFKFLKNWWTNHILHMDKQYAPYITSKDGANYS